VVSTAAAPTHAWSSETVFVLLGTAFDYATADQPAFFAQFQVIHAALVGEMNQTVRALALAGLRQHYPADTTPAMRRCLADLLLGPELAPVPMAPFRRKTSADRADHGDAVGS
jgi:hypothetical protein